MASEHTFATVEQHRDDLIRRLRVANDALHDTQMERDALAEQVRRKQVWIDSCFARSDRREEFQSYTAGDLVEMANHIANYMLRNERCSLEQLVRDLMPEAVELLRDKGWLVEPQPQSAAGSSFPPQEPTG